MNKWGLGDFSTTTSILAAGAPSQVSMPTTTIDSTTGGVKIAWSAPSANGGAISSYTIEI